MKTLKLLAVALCAVTLIGCASSSPTTELVKPTKEQLEFMDLEVGAFIHYGLNVFTGQEHGDGKCPPSMFNPRKQDVEQWVITSKKMGATYACLTVRHEGGFCLWPTATSDYSIANSPYKDGKGDIAREFVDACRKHGIKPGFYFSVNYNAHHVFDKDDDVKWGPEWDRLFDKNFAEMGPEGQKELEERELAQFRELMTNYGEIFYIWNDHWGNYMAPNIQHKVLDLMRELQPNCLMLGPDVTTPGCETGHVVYPMWNAMYTEDNTGYTRAKTTMNDSDNQNDYGLLETDSNTGHPLGNFWRSRECTTNSGFSTGGWFWHPGQTRPHSLGRHIDLYYRTVGLGASTIINLPPDSNGLIPDDVVAAAEAFGNEIKARFANPIAQQGSVKKVKKDIIELKWKTPQEINTIMLMENIANGQKVAKYTLEAYVNGEWQEMEPQNHYYTPSWTSIFPKTVGFETIGHKKIDRVTPVVTNKIRFKVLEAVVPTVELRDFAVYNCAPYEL